MFSFKDNFIALNDDRIFYFSYKTNFFQITFICVSSQITLICTKDFFKNLRHLIMLTFISNTSFVIDFKHIILIHQVYHYVQKHDDTSKLTTTIKKFVRFIILTNSKISEKISFRNINKSQSMKFVVYFKN